jgi:hypothetical protein
VVSSVTAATSVVQSASLMSAVRFRMPSFLASVTVVIEPAGRRAADEDLVLDQADDVWLIWVGVIR